MSIFSRTAVSEAEAMAAMELDQNTRKEVADILDDLEAKGGKKCVICKVRDCKCSSKEYLTIIVAYERSKLGDISHYVDINGGSWEYATAINMDGTEMTVYDYNKTK